MVNASQELLGRIQQAVLKSQKSMTGKLRGQYVIRDDITFLVVGTTKDVFVVSDLTTPVGQTVRIGTDVFLSKKVQVLKDVGGSKQ